MISFTKSYILDGLTLYQIDYHFIENGFAVSSNVQIYLFFTGCKLLPIMRFNRVFPKCFHWIQWIQWQKNYYFKKIAGLEPTISCVRDRDSTTATTETQLTENTVKLILIHASVDSLNSLNSVKFVLFRENPIIFGADSREI